MTKRQKTFNIIVRKGKKFVTQLKGYPVDSIQTEFIARYNGADYQLEPTPYGWQIDINRQISSNDRDTTAIAITYEAWKAWKMGDAPKVTVPAGKRAEWAARLHCEKQLSKAVYYNDLSGPRKQLKAGCKRDRIDRMRRRDKGGVWGEFIDIAKGVINGYTDALEDCYWQGAKEIIDEAYGDAIYKLYLLGNR